jgi:hypothetical protein
MFRMTDAINPISRFAFARASEPKLVSVEQVRLPDFDPDGEIGALTEVYGEIARRLSRNAYTSHAHAMAHHDRWMNRGA